MAKQTPSAVTGTGVFHVVRQAEAEYEAARFGTPAVLAWGANAIHHYIPWARLEGMHASFYRTTQSIACISLFFFGTGVVWRIDFARWFA